MTEQELKKYKKRWPQEVFSKLGLEFIDKQITDEYGVYSTGMFEYKGKEILINIEGGAWHMSIATKHPLGYYELKQLRYKFMPDNMQVAQIFPSRAEFVNVHENCYHLWQIDKQTI